MRISVIGGSEVDEDVASVAEAIGREIATREHTLICGGLGGVMTAACRGAREAEGETIGILPGTDPGEANPHVETAIVTGLGDARNALVPLNGDAVIAIDGAAGTLSEIGHARIHGRPVAGIGTFDIPGVEAVDTPEAALDYVEAAGP